MTPTDKPARLILRDPARDPREDEQACQEAVSRANWFDAIDRPERWPVDTDTAEALLRDGGCFDVPAGELLRLVSHNLLPAPVQDEAGPEWAAVEVLEAARLFEYRRQWQHGSPHDAKRLDQELILGAARRDGDVSEIAGPLLGTVDIAHVISNMIHLESREARIMNAVVLRLLLEHQHGVRV